jgi:hypothetical protein
MRRWLRSEAVVGTRPLAMLAGCAVLALLAAGGFEGATADATGRIERIQLKTERDATKVIVMLSRPLAFDVRVLDAEAQKSTRRLVLDFANATLAPEVVPPIAVEDGFVRQIRTGQFTATTARIVLDLASDTKHSVEAYESPPHVTIAIAAPMRAGAGDAASKPGTPAVP